MEGLVGFYVLLAVIVAAGASGRGRSAIGSFLIAFLLSPLLALIALLLTPNLKEQRRQEDLEYRRHSDMLRACERTRLVLGGSLPSCRAALEVSPVDRRCCD